MQTAVSKILKISDRSEQFWRVQWSAVQVSHQDIRGLRGPFHPWLPQQKSANQR